MLDSLVGHYFYLKNNTDRNHVIVKLIITQ